MQYIRFTSTLAVLLFAFFMQGGCQSGTSDQGSTKSSTSETDKDKEMKKSPFSGGLQPLEEAQDKKEMDVNGRDEDLGLQTITGTLISSKGNMPMIGTLMLDQDEVFEEGSREWKPEYAALKNKRVTVVGPVTRHWCGPHEQCLSQGYIDHMRPIQEIRKGSK